MRRKAALINKAARQNKWELDHSVIEENTRFIMEQISN